MPFTVTEEDIRLHFTRCGAPPTCPRITPISAGPMASVRLLTKKGTNEPRGCAFIEYEDAESHGVRGWCEMRAFDCAQKALGLHLTKLHGRLINVELTVGGGGKYVP